MRKHKMEIFKHELYPVDLISIVKRYAWGTEPLFDNVQYALSGLGWIKGWPRWRAVMNPLTPFDSAIQIFQMVALEQEKFRAMPVTPQRRREIESACRFAVVSYLRKNIPGLPEGQDSDLYTQFRCIMYRWYPATKVDLQKGVFKDLGETDDPDAANDKSKSVQERAEISTAFHDAMFRAGPLIHLRQRQFESGEIDAETYSKFAQPAERLPLTQLSELAEINRPIEGFSGIEISY